MFPNSEGKRVPDVTFRTREDGQWKDITTDDLFKGKTVIVFALPGAYTPTCSTTHLPRYNELAATFSKHGVDEIVCLSVNDGFVMSEWQKDQNAPNITFIPDGNGEFSDKMGLLVDKTNLGFGKRSWRYSMLVKDGVVQKMFIEPDKAGDPFEVSDADTMLNHIAPSVKAPEPAVIFSKAGCPHCARAKDVLNANGIAYEEVELGKGITFSTVRAVSGKGTTPQVFIGGKLIGGADEVEAHFASKTKKAA
ncbi:glutathione peroxidase [Usitatibacter palustris]|uniref:Hybrid peroxiredoxin hyPrx5 n=1 Tax=Usitatibacter palustris TaxID=2732487 RepID=A0A6M4H5Z5_9PROT|nr:glutathione peroxidase [Usitatibacter palustris]QJR14732.1 Hybrid peroxiredoxin hyPrx5 [Usitatibacter palustris]